MEGRQQDCLVRLSQAVAARAAAARGLVAAITAGRHRRSGIVWGADVVVASEQVFPKTQEAAVTLADGRSLKARVAGRDAGTNIVALRLEQTVDNSLPAPAEPHFGALVLALGATTDGSAAVRLGIVRALGPAWRSLRGGLIDRRILLDLTITPGEEGGPVLAADGGLLGMSAAGPGGGALVIPAATISRVLGPLLTHGRVERGWLGMALHPVALPAEAAGSGQDRGLMVMQVAAESPAARAGVQPGDILVGIDGTPARHPRELGRGLGPDSIGKPAELRLLRAGAAVTLTATIAARPAA